MSVASIFGRDQDCEGEESNPDQSCSRDGRGFGMNKLADSGRLSPGLNTLLARFERSYHLGWFRQTLL